MCIVSFVVCAHMNVSQLKGSGSFIFVSKDAAGDLSRDDVTKFVALFVKDKIDPLHPMKTKLGELKKRNHLARQGDVMDARGVQEFPRALQRESLRNVHTCAQFEMLLSIVSYVVHCIQYLDKNASNWRYCVIVLSWLTCRTSYDTEGGGTWSIITHLGRELCAHWCPLYKAQRFQYHLPRRRCLLNGMLSAHRLFKFVLLFETLNVGAPERGVIKAKPQTVWLIKTTLP